ncbi:tetratricopeptide repeat protein [Adhaeribacter rhizoryzae]|uniref:histidine kinase n=1 Tax=Adhaeribacter rhizoryzae TaxID=2607907 RepID=A0A5M6D9N7_9BACT|nr:tetratricopeptide repeat protein [Adhaeribacter rhizoryzae]KAA5544224.1 sensor histidine kinase [Adhaeribacter rhizoryzae]
MKKLLLFSFFLFSQITLLAQQNLPDSLVTALAAAKDTTKVNLLLSISKSYAGTDLALAVKYAQEAKQLAEQHHFPKGAAAALKNMGLAYYQEGKYEEVLKYWQQSLRVFKSINDKAGVANLLGNIGAVYFNKGDDARAIEYYLQSLQVAEEIGDKQRMTTTMSNIGAVYNNNKATHQKALEYYTKALKISEEIGYKAGIGTLLVNIGEIYLAREDDAAALQYFLKSLKTLEETDKQDKVAYALNNIAKVYTRQGNLTQALNYHQRALATAQKVKANLEMAQSLVGIAQIYDKQEKPEAALNTYNQAQKIAQELGSNYELKAIYEGLATLYGKAGDYKKAYDYQLLLSSVKDQIYNTETNEKIVDLQANYESEKKQAQINLLTKDKALQHMDLQRQKIIKNALFAGLAFILILAGILYRNYRNKVKVNWQLTRKNVEINQQKEEIATQRDRLEQMYNNLISAQAQLIQAEKMASLGQLTAGVAHEINNPINFVSAGIDSLRHNFTEIMEVVEGYLALDPDTDNKQTLQKLNKLKKQVDLDELIEESEQLLRSIKNGATRTKEIVRSLKNFTRLDENTLKVADIHEGLDSTLVILNNQIKERIKISKNYGHLEPINCYPGQLNQVFMNILGNAIQAIKGEGTIAIKTYTEDDFAVIRIKDSGSGMTAEVKKHIFEPFFTTKDVGEGTGLGLSISYGIIEKHKGKIEVESQPGAGTEFIIRIPLILSETAKPLAVATA